MKTLFVLSSIGIAAAGIAAVILGLIWIVAAIRRKKTAVKKACVSAVVVALICSVVNGVAYFKGGAPERRNIPDNDDGEKIVTTEITKGEDTTMTPPAFESETEKKPETSKETESTKKPEITKEPETSKVPETSSTSEQPPEETVSNEKPDYDKMIAELEKSVIDTIRNATEGKFSQENEVHITFAYYTGFVLIKAQYADNLTSKLIKEGIWRDIGDTLSAVTFDAEGFDMVIDEELTVPCYAIERIGFNITNPNGDIVLKAEYTKEDIQNTDWEKLTVKEIEALADWKA